MMSLVSVNTFHIFSAVTMSEPPLACTSQNTRCKSSSLCAKMGILNLPLLTRYQLPTIMRKRSLVRGCRVSKTSCMNRWKEFFNSKCQSTKNDCSCKMTFTPGLFHLAGLTRVKNPHSLLLWNSRQQQSTSQTSSQDLICMYKKFEQIVTRL